MPILDKWVGEGKTVAQSELRQIAKDLNRSKWYKHALEVRSMKEAARSNAFDHRPIHLKVKAPNALCDLQLRSQVLRSINQ
ncbi:uncharacterized protein A4U43_UnF7690 [Asparagus officinalis]|uniref:Uncharacterized protein n=1 Tax=Asparagus officinalis TaxID=4686 RepID=A0A1R3L649_ASPOF|nr:uncharacterized protein A4U43_UnF7690 [Asparagus officinalis]